MKKPISDQQRAANRARQLRYRTLNPEKVRAARAKYDAKRRPPKEHVQPAPCPIGIPQPTEHSQDPACIAIRERFHAYRQSLRKS